MGDLEWKLYGGNKKWDFCVEERLEFERIADSKNVSDSAGKVIS